jgi:hypothetical protein
MATSINSLYQALEISILQYLSAAEITLMSNLNKHWQITADNNIAWKFANYHRTYVLDRHNKNWEYDRQDSMYLNKLRKKDYDDREKLKEINNYPSKNIISKCGDLTLTISTDVLFYNNDLALNDILFLITPAKEWLHIFHKTHFINLTNLSLCNCIITPNILKSIIRNSPKLQKFENYINHEIYFEYIYRIIESSIDDFEDACHDLIAHPSLIHLRLNCALMPGCVKALIVGFSNSKLEYLHCSLTTEYIMSHSKKMNLLLTEISKINTLKSLLIMSEGFFIKKENYKGFEILDNSSLTYLNISFPCQFSPNTFINLKELVTCCDVHNQLFPKSYIDPFQEQYVIDQFLQQYVQDPEKITNFNKWLRQSKLEKLCLIKSDFITGLAKLHFMNILEDHAFLKVLTLVEWNNTPKYTFYNQIDNIYHETVYANKYLMVDEQFSPRKFKSLKELRIVEREDAIHREKGLATVFTFAENQTVTTKKLLIDDQNWNKIFNAFPCTEV